MSEDAEILEIIKTPEGQALLRGNQKLRAKLVRLNVVKPSELPEPKKNKSRSWRGGRVPPNGDVTPKKVGTRGRTSIRPLWDGEQLRQKLQAYDRTPFLDLLALFMECTPTPQTIMAFADKYPDRFIAAMSSLGKMGGFSERREIDVNMQQSVAKMSDSQLEDKLRDVAYRLSIPLPNIITLNARDISDDDARMVAEDGHDTEEAESS